MSVDYDKKYYIGKSEEGQWASVYAYKPRDQSIYLEKGEIFAVISLSGPNGFATATAGNLILDYLHETYFESNDISPLICLENAVIKTAGRLSEIVDRDTNLGDEGIDLNIATIVFVDKIAYFVRLGKGGIYIYRDEYMVDVTIALKDPTGNGYIKSASTVVEPDDSFMLLTPLAIDAYTKDELNTALRNFDNSALSNKPLETESLLAFILISSYQNTKRNNVVVDKEEVLEETAKTALDDGESGQLPTGEDSSKSTMEIIQAEDTDEDTMNNDPLVHVPYEPDDSTEASVKVNLRTTKGNILIKRVLVIFKQFGQMVRNKWNGLKPKGMKQNTFQYLRIVLRSKLSRAWNFIYDLFWIKFLHMDKGIYLKNARRGTNWRLIVTIGIIATSMLYLFITISLSNAERARIIDRSKKMLSKIETQLSEIDPKITSILGVFDTYTREKTIYQSKLDKDKKELSVLNVIDEDKKKKEDLLRSINSLMNRLNRKIVVKTPTVVYDFAEKVDETVELTDLEVNDGKLYVTDANRGAIYSLDYSGNNYKELVTGLTTPQSIVLNEDGQLIAVDRDPAAPFFNINMTSGAINRYSGIIGDGFDSITQIDDFKFYDANRIYFIKSTGSPVQYISEVGAGYAGSYDKFSDNSFANTRDINVVDGKVYLLRPGEGAVRYYGDQKDQFNLYGLTSAELQDVVNSTSFEVTGPFVVYGNSLGKSIVFMTKQNQKNITQSAFVAQITVGKNNKNFLANIKEIKIDFKTNDIFVLDGTRILKFAYLPVERLNY